MSSVCSDISTDENTMRKINNKKLSILLLPLLLTAGIFLFGHYTHAAWQETVISGILGVFVSALGLILTLVIKGLIFITTYQHFIDSQAVVMGWVIVRDVCNMFFVVILMIIAFGTILHLENYSYKKWLPKLILMAVLINFSKTICGLLIDVAQVVMFTFVNAFKDVGGANLTDILGISKIVQMSEGDNVSLWTLIGAYVLGLIYLLIAIIVITTMLAMLVMRLVMIWIYVVLSPLAYLLAAFPGGEKYASQWWGEFIKNLIVGPVLAFFIWLSFAALQTGGVATGGIDDSIGTDMQALGMKDQSTTATEASKPSALIKFVIAIGMLIGGLQIAQSIGGAAGSMAGSGMAALQKGKGLALAGGKRAALGIGKTSAKLGGAALGGADRTLGAFVDKGITRLVGKKKSGEPLTKFANKGLFTATALGLKNAPGNIATRVRSTFNKNKEINDRRREYLEEEKTKGAAAILTFSGKQYKKDEATNEFQEIDNKGKIIKDAQGKANVLTVGQPGKEKRVKAMSSTVAAWRDAWYASGSQARAAANKAQEEKISKEQTKIADSGQTTDEMRRSLMSPSTGADKKMALAMTLAIKAGFKNRQEVAEAKKYLGSNTLLQNKFNDEVDSKQAHLNYDLSADDKGKYKNENDVAKFKNRIDAGKIDSTRLSPETFSDPDSGAVDILREYHGADFNRVIEANYKKNKRSGDAISAALLARRKPDANGSIVDDKSAQLHAKLTGKVEESFTVNNKLDENALKKYLSSAKAGDLNKMDTRDIENSGLKDELKVLLAKNMNFAKLKSLYKQGDNPDLVNLIIKQTKDKGVNDELADSISRDAELSTV